MIQLYQYYLNVARQNALDSGIDINKPAPTVRLSYRALDKNGDVHDTDSLDDIEKIDRHNYKTIYNKEDQKLKDAHWDMVRVVEQKAISAWYTDLRNEYNYMNAETFGIVYSRAYDDGHSSGYDSVADSMEKYADFANSIINANKG